MDSRFGKAACALVRASFFASVLLLSACGDKSGAPAATKSSASPAARSEADQIFSTRCAACHGPQGRGDGPASSGLTPKPANFTDHAWQARVTDPHVEQIIQFGGAAVGRSPAMPSNPDLTSKPEVVAALREHIRGLAN